MMIKTVTYRRLVSGPDFSNRAIEATAEIERDRGETPDDAFSKLVAWVEKQINIDVTYDMKRMRLNDLEITLANKQDQLEGAKELLDFYVKRRREIEGILTEAQALGVKITDELRAHLFDDIPF